MKKSNCCQVDVRVEGKTTKYYMCNFCNEVCDAIDLDKEKAQKEWKLIGAFLLGWALPLPVYIIIFFFIGYGLKTLWDFANGKGLEDTK